MKIRKLKDGRWQVRREDGVCFSLRASTWFHVADLIDEGIQLERELGYPDHKQSMDKDVCNQKPKHERHC